MVPHIDLFGTTVAARNIVLMLGVGMLLLLHHNFSRVKFDEHGAVCFQLLHRNGEPEIVQEQKL